MHVIHGYIDGMIFVPFLPDHEQTIEVIMKYIAIFPIMFFMLLAAASTALAQEDGRGQDAGSEATSGRQDAEQAHGDAEGNDIPFVDENGDGINDNLGRSVQRGNGNASGKQQRGRRRDHFIDNDGDGINDNRCSGMGITQGKRRGQQKGGRK